MYSYRKLFVIILLIAVFAFNIMAFFTTKSHSPNFWSAYGFTMVAFLLQVVYVLLALENTGSMKRIFHGLPVIYVGMGYLIVQLIWGILGIFISDIPLNIYTVVSVIILAIYAIWAVMALIGKQAIQKTDDKTKVRTSFIKFLLVDAENLAANCVNTDLTSDLKALTDKVRYSDPMSVEALAEIEERIRGEFSVLKNMIETRDYSESKNHCAAVSSLLDERGRICRMLK